MSDDPLDHIEKATANRLSRAHKAFSSCEAYWGSLIDSRLEQLLHSEGIYVLIDTARSKRDSLRCELCYSTPEGIQRKQVKFAASDVLVVEGPQKFTKLAKWVAKRGLKALRKDAVWKPEMVLEKSKEEELDSLFEAGRVSRISLNLTKECETEALGVTIQLNEDRRGSLLKQLQAHIDFGNRNIQRLWGISSNEMVCTVLLENVAVGPISRMMTDIDRGKLPSLTRQLHSALLFLEQMDFVHKKLTLDACFLSNYGELKLAIFCLSPGLVPRRVDREDVETCRWIPWECVGPQGKEFTKKSVVWSYGTVIWSMYHYGALPFENREPEQIMSQEFRKSYELPVEESLFNESVQELVGNCWQDEEVRMSMFRLKGIVAALH